MRPSPTLRYHTSVSQVVPKRVQIQNWSPIDITSAGAVDREFENDIGPLRAPWIEPRALPKRFNAPQRPKDAKVPSLSTKMDPGKRF